MEEMDTEYYPFMEYFNYALNLYNKYNHIKFNWFTVGTETEEIDTESESSVTDAKLPDEGEGNGDKVDTMEEMGDGQLNINHLDDRNLYIKYFDDRKCWW